jgi:hypothetical protein
MQQSQQRDMRLPTPGQFFWELGRMFDHALSMQPSHIPSVGRYFQSLIMRRNP